MNGDNPKAPVIKHLIGLPLSALHDGTLLLEVLKYEASVLMPIAAIIPAEKFSPVMSGLIERLSADLEKTYKECGVTSQVLALEVCHAILTSTVASFANDKEQREAQDNVAQLLIGLVAHSISRGQVIGAPSVNPYVEAQGSPNAGTA